MEGFVTAPSGLARKLPIALWRFVIDGVMHVVQPSSVPVDRRMRRGKSDGIDAELLLRTLLAWLRGEPRVCSMVPIPDEADEDARRCVRERSELVSERVGLVNRIGAILATLGADDYNMRDSGRDHHPAGCEVSREALQQESSPRIVVGRKPLT